MSAEISSVSDGVLTFTISGLLTQTELAAAQERAAEIIKQQGKIRFLVLVENFSGFEKGGDWADVSFQFENDEFIEKIAIVGEKKWENVALMFTAKGVRRVPIEFFTREEVAKARAWLAA